MSAWSPEDDAVLFRMWSVEGLSASMCAQKLPGGRSRNSIIGRVNRMGWNRPHAAAPGTFQTYPKRACVAPKIERRTGRGNSPGSAAARAIGQQRTPGAGYYEVRPTDVLSPNAVVWTQRAAGQCAYPVDGEGADVRSCCNPTDGGTYCSPHSRVMYAPSTKLNTYGIEVGGRKSRAKAGISDSIFAKWAA